MSDPIQIGIEPEVISLVAGLLDETGSMQDVYKETMVGYNAFIENVRKEQEGKKAYVSTFTFDKHADQPILRVIQDAEDITTVEPISEKHYKPRGWTPLYDAIGMSIEHIERAVKAKGVNKVTLLIQTDGAENSSKEYTLSSVKAKIEELTKLGWQIVFLGADLSNARSIGRGLGVMSANSMSYDKSASVETFTSMSNATRGYRTGGIAASASLDLTDDEKKKLGDKA